MEFETTRNFSYHSSSGLVIPLNIYLLRLWSLPTIQIVLEPRYQANVFITYPSKEHIVPFLKAEIFRSKEHLPRILAMHSQDFVLREMEVVMEFIVTSFHLRTRTATHVQNIEREDVPKLPDAFVDELISLGEECPGAYDRIPGFAWDVLFVAGDE